MKFLKSFTLTDLEKILHGNVKFSEFNLERISTLQQLSFTLLLIPPLTVFFAVLPFPAIKRTPHRIVLI